MKKYIFSIGIYLFSLLASQVACENTSANSTDIYRFIDGVDTLPVKMTASEVNRLLNDDFANLVLKKGDSPFSVDQVVSAIKTGSSELSQSNYMVGEGSQIPLTTAPRTANRNLRYVLNWQNGRNQQIYLSAAPGGHSGFLQVISWDNIEHLFNFYEVNRVNGSQQWVWKGNSTYARKPETIGKGCFDCHHNGVVIMKELQFPWNNWQSELATISPVVVPESVASETYFKNLKGANELEQTIKGGFQNYYNNWIRKRYIRGDGSVQLIDVDKMLRHVMTNTTVNMRSTPVQSDGNFTSPPNAPISGIPSELLLNDTVLRTSLGINYTLPDLTIGCQDYLEFITDKDFELVQDLEPSYRKKGSTFFSIFFPGPSSEDNFMIQQLLGAEVIDKKFTLALTMVDFHNPVFSSKRTSLMKYASDITSGTINAKGSSVVKDFVSAVETGARATSSTALTLKKFQQLSAEQQFLYIWHSDNDSNVSSKLITAYLADIDAMSAEKKLSFLMSLAQKRREQFANAPLIKNLNEFSLLLPKNNFLN